MQKGAGFAVADKKIQYDEFLTATQQACENLSQCHSLALKAEVTDILKNASQNKSNLTKEELKAIDSLKKDQSIVITPADKGKALVIMDKVDYVSKMEEKFADTTTYVRIENDPTQEIKEELSSQLLSLLDSGIIDKNLHRDLFPKTTQIPRAYGSPKIHKPGYPLREIVDSTNSVAKKIDKYVSRIIKTYTVDNQYAIKNSKDFVDKISTRKIKEGHKLISFDVVALYPSVPQDEALQLFEEQLDKDENLKKKTPIPAKKLMKLFRTCLKRTYFVFNRKLYQQIDGLAIGASSSVFLAELFLMRLERKAMETFANPPDFWFRYVDDTFTSMLEEFIDLFLNHLNRQHQRINFTIELEENRELPFLDTCVKIEANGTFSTKVYRKKTHTNQYLNFNSNHHLSQKVGIVSTLMKRRELITNVEDQEKEKNFVQDAFRACEYPEWTIKEKKKNNENVKKKEYQPSLGRISIPYNKGLSERVAGVMRKYHIDTCHKPTATIKNILCSKAKDKVDPLDKSGAIYSIKCSKHDGHYVGETGRAARVRFYEHRVMDHDDARRSHSLGERKALERAEPTGERRSNRNVKKVDYKAMHNGSKQHLTLGKTAVSEHMALFDHDEGDIEVKILGFESDWKKRRVKEAIAISKIKPNLNDDDGLKLSAIYESLPSKFALETRSTEMTSLRNRIPKEAVLWERHTVEQSTEEGS